MTLLVTGQRWATGGPHIGLGVAAALSDARAETAVSGSPASVRPAQ